MIFLKTNNQPPELNRLQPYAMLGAGKLTSTLWKTGNDQAGWRYSFNLFHMNDRGHVSQWFSPDDLVDLVKLARVLAATLADDGCLTPVRRSELAHLFALLDQILPPED